MKTDIVMVTWERPEITELTIRTIQRNTKPENYRLIVVDNGSSKKMTEMLQMLHDNGKIDELHLLPENLGLEPARNIGLRSVQSDYFVCADNDCLPQEIDGYGDWLEKLHLIIENHPEIVSIACRTQVMIGTGNIFEWYEDKEYVPFAHPGGSLRLMKTDIVKNIGGWRDDIKGRGSEERYIGGKIAELGLMSAFAVDVKCLHLFGKKDTTDRWGYDKDWAPEETGHSDIWHPALEQGDDIKEIIKYTGEENAEKYFHKTV